MLDDISYDGCPYVEDLSSTLWADPNTYASIQDPFFNILREPIAVAFSLSEEDKASMTFQDLYHYCDTLICENYDGVPSRYPFTEEEWFYVTAA
jgi:hypothetical protein